MKKAQFLILNIIVLCIIGFMSCSSDDDISNPSGGGDNHEDIVKVKMFVTKTELRLFESTELGITNSAQYLSHDSVVWSIPEIFESISKNGYRLFKFTQSFYLPGEYNVFLSGYKDGKIISADTVTITVENKEDFLGLNWNNLAAYEPFNFLKRTSRDNIEYSIHMDIINTPVQFVSLKYNGNNYQNEEEWISFHKDSKQKYYDYVISLYGKALFYYPGNDISQSNLTEEYNKRFTIALDEIQDNSEYVPVAIWETPTTNISLVGSIKSGIETDINYFRVVAQQRKKN